MLQYHTYNEVFRRVTVPVEGKGEGRTVIPVLWVGNRFRWHGYDSVSMEEFAQSGQYHESPDLVILRVLKDPVVSTLLKKSGLSRVQFEALLIDQLGDEIANRRLSRAEMAKIAHHGTGISRGALNRTLAQAKANVSGAIHTLLLLGYSGILDSPSLAPFVEASETLKSNTMLARESGKIDNEDYERLMEGLMRDLEEAAEALTRRRRDV